jgi:CRISPR-associated protein Csh2
MSNIISNNSDFLFLFDATQSNPNGDIDQENKPRMDYDTDTNLCSDTRVKRTIRDYLRQVKDLDIFVDMEGNNKVSPDTRLKNTIVRLIAEADFATKTLGDDSLLKTFNAIKGVRNTAEEIFKYLQGERKAKEAEISGSSKEDYQKLNYHLLAHVVKQKFIDIRFFGSAFAIKGFTKSYIGPIQLNWGYSMHKVKIMESSSVVTIMNDDASTIGKDYRVHYSLLAFNGTINKYAAKSTELTTDDVAAFREAIWSSVAALPTRSKINQYPKLYVELVYNDGFSNGQFGDLRQYVKAIPNVEDNAIRRFDDLTLDVSALQKLIADDAAQKPEERKIKNVIIKTPTGNTL